MRLGRDLSAACFEDECADCMWGLCECKCHDDQQWDLVEGGWYDRDEDEVDW